MKNADGVWFPDNEKHLVKMLKLAPKVDGKGTYQTHKLEAALKQVTRWRCALDIGMHVGLWAMHLTKRFKTVIGFEPVAEHIACLRLNMAGVANYEVHQCALGNRAASVGLKFMDGSTGSTQIANDGNGIPMLKLDDFKFDAVDFIKIDVEGYEFFVVQGGEATIRTHKPVIILEQKNIPAGHVKSNYGRGQYDASNLLRSWGAQQRFEIHGDVCLCW